MIKKSLTAIAIGSLLIGCGNSNEIERSQWSTNPNGDSELALLMRLMYDDAMRMKKNIEDGEIPEMVYSFDKIHTAQATEPEKAASMEYKVFADAYLATLGSIETNDFNKVKTAYSGMVESCMNCHTALCPGPRVKIRKLEL